MNEESYNALTKKLNELQLKINTPNKQVLSPCLFFPMYLADVGSSWGLILPKGKITKIVCRSEVKDAILILTFIKSDVTTTQEYKLKLGMNIFEDDNVFSDFTTIRASFTCPTLNVPLIATICFQCKDFHIALKEETV